MSAPSLKNCEAPAPSEKRRVWLETMDLVESWILRLYPGMPAKARALCVLHSCQPNTHRVFSFCDGRPVPRVTPALVTRAVKAHARHKFTGYDQWCCFGSIYAAKRRAAGEVKVILQAWKGCAP